jgi:hypothetical protein
LLTLGTTEEKIVYGPVETFTTWPSLKQAGFESIDCVLQRPDDPQLAYYFSGEEYAVIRVIPGELLVFIYRVVLM